MAISHPLITRQTVFAAKAETTNGTAISLTGSEGVFNAFEVEIQPDIEPNERESQGSLDMLPSVPGASGASVSLTTELSNSGSGTAPQWFSVLLAASGFGISGSAATVQSGNASAVTATCGHYLDGLFYSAAGCMFDLEVDFQSGRTIPMNWTGRGIWVAPSDVSMITPTYPTALPPVFKGATVTIGGTTFVIPRMNLKLGNDVQLREDGNSTSGYKSAVIVNRKLALEVDIEASLLATYNPYTVHSASTEVALSAAVGSGSNGVVTITAPKLQHRGAPRLTKRNGIAYWTFDYGLNKSAAAGDDSLVFTLS